MPFVTVSRKARKTGKTGRSDRFSSRIPGRWHRDRTSPTGHTHTTKPGSAMLFPTLCLPTGELWLPKHDATIESVDRGARMPRRRRPEPKTPHAASGPNANSTTPTAPNATNPHRSKPVWSAPPRAVVRPAPSIGLWLTQSDVCCALSLSLSPLSVCLPVAGIRTGQTSRRHCVSGRGISMHATSMPCAGCSPTM